MRYRFLIAILGLLVATASAQVSPHPFRGSITTAGADCSTATSCVVVTLPTGTASATIAIDDDTGSFSGTQQFEGSVDGSAWIAMKPTSNSTNTNSSTTATGSWQFNPSSYIKIRVRASARASGTAAITINWGPAVASSGGGGGSGTVTNAASLTLNHVMLGAGSAAAAVDSALVTDGAGALSGATSISTGTAPTGVGSTATATFAATEGDCTTGLTPTAATSWLCFKSDHFLYVSLNGAANVKVGTPSVTETTSTPIATTIGQWGAYYDNMHATAGTAIVYTLPATSIGAQACFTNSYNGSAANTGTLTITPAASSYIISKGVLSTVSKGWISGGAAGDSACVVGKDATHWTLYVGSGTWTAVP